MKKRAIKKEFATLLKKLMPQVVAKLMRNEAKYRFGNAWKVKDWEDKCQTGLRYHADKGDPIDVIIYGFFCWYHGWSTKLKGSMWLTTKDYRPTCPVGGSRRVWVYYPAYEHMGNAIPATVGELFWANEIDLDECADDDEKYTGWMVERDGAELITAFVGPSPVYPSHFMEQTGTPQPPAL